MKILLFLSLTFYTLISTSENHFVFANAIDLENFVDKKLYAQCVKNLPICCVDIFLYNQCNESYLLIERLNPPAQGILWFPGGRIFKGESFFEAAIRKCKEEIGIEVKPLQIIDVYSTIFADSAWDCQTHTINIAVLALLPPLQQLHLNQDHGTYQWRSLNKIPENPYLNQVYQKAIILLFNLKI